MQDTLRLNARNVDYFQVPVWRVDTAAVVWVAAVRAALQSTATVMQTVICLKIAAAMSQVTVRSKVLLANSIY